MGIPPAAMGILPRRAAAPAAGAERPRRGDTPGGGRGEPGGPYQVPDAEDDGAGADMAAEAAAVGVEARPGRAQHLRGSSGLRAVPRLSPRRSAEAGPGTAAGPGPGPPLPAGGTESGGTQPSRRRAGVQSPPVPRGGSRTSADRGAAFDPFRARTGTTANQPTAGRTPERWSNHAKAPEDFKIQSWGDSVSWQPGLSVPGVSGMVGQRHSPGGPTQSFSGCTWNQCDGSEHGTVLPWLSLYVARLAILDWQTHRNKTPL